MPKIKLLPCPFCGKRDTAKCLTVAECECIDEPTEWDKTQYGIVCDASILGGCGASTGWNHETPEEAAKEWNTRASCWIPCSERMPEPGDIVLVYAHVSVSDEEYWDEQFTAISVPKKMFHAFKGEEGTCWIGASNLHRLGDMISAETGFHFRGSEYVDTMRITHWMPLPKPPQRKDDTK